jgi:tRNA(Ile)-lysidine synthase
VTPDALRDAAFAALDALRPEGPLGVAVSGGGDSLALMLLAAEWGAARRVSIAVASVDHGLRPEAAAEAAAAVARAAALGLPATVLRWRGWDGRGNLQAAAREARTALLADWAAREGLAAVALGHTLDDQAETVLLRLARGSGVDGLSAMAPGTRRAGTLWLRPLLGLRREALRDWLAARGEMWVDDPSNDDPAFARVAARRALAALAPLGIEPAGLAATAARLRRARAALEAQTDSLWAAAARWGAAGALRLDAPSLRAAPDEIALRLLARGMSAVSGEPLRPRLAALESLLAAAREGSLGRGRTLHGCVAWTAAGAVALAREPAAAVTTLPAPLAALWDGRWRVAAVGPGEVRALGPAGEAALAAARRAGWRPPARWARAPRPARLTTPALWLGDRLACAPAAGFGAGLDARLAPRGCVELDIGGLM